MGLREKTDFNLQIISLGCAILVILVLYASRHYTSDWRERRLFRRQLAETQQRLQGTQEERKADGGNGRRRWKRFIAALPLMPLATAYVLVRLGWDVFELLVFCSIDFVRAMGIRSFVVARGLASGLGALGRRIEIGRRLGDLFVFAVERAVVWMFGVFFPRIGDFISWCGGSFVAFAGWWSDTGGSLAAEYVELVVLQGIVPAVAAVADGSKGLYRRSVWLGTRVFQALGVLGGDILRDIFTVGSWLSCGYLWLVSAERWWFDRRIKATIVAWLAPMHQGLRAAYAAFVRRFMPWGMHCVSLAVELAVYRCLFPAATWCRDVADQAVQAAVGVLVQGADLFMRGYASFARSMAKAANVCCQRCVAVSRYMHMAWQLLSVSHRWILHAWAAINGFVHRHQWIVAGLADAYSQARNAVFVPAVRLVIKASRLAWLKILGPFVFSLQTLAVRWAWPRTKSAAERVLRQIGSFVDWGHVQLALSACWIRASAFVVAAYVWMAQSAFVAYMGETVVWLADGMRHRTNALLALMWPMVRRSWTDASQAMCDLYVQLVSAVDFVVAMVGDYIVGYAQSSVVHGRADSGQADGLAK